MDIVVEPVQQPVSGDFTFKLTLFLGGLLLLLILLALLARWWERLYRAYEAGEEGLTRRLLKNSLTPTVANLINKGVDTGFAIVVLHYLGPTKNGYYAIAALLVSRYLITVTDFGLGTLTTREVARDHRLANRYLINTTLVRWGLSALSLPVVAAIILAYRQTAHPLQPETQTALWILTASLFPTGLAAGISSLFFARERMEIPAFAGLLTNTFKVFAGVGVLLAGWGVVGLAASALLVTTLNAFLFLYLQLRFLFRPRVELDLALWPSMLRESFPLLLNNLLLVVFFRFDVFVLQGSWGESVVGAYDAAYKLPNATSEVPYYIIMAFFPLLSRYAQENRDRLRHTYHMAIKALLLVALPLAVTASLLAPEVIYILGGTEYLPDSAIALSILIWYLPLSYISGVLQYVLIAANRQWTITVAFAVAALFNVVMNLVWVPSYGYRAASILTILTEVALFVPLLLLFRRTLGQPQLFQLAWRPAVAALVMALPMFWLRQQVHWGAALVAGPPLYLGTLLLLRTFTPDERALLQRLWPGRGRGGKE
jgi:O-antigen/teichoic acid export membrane protein